MIIKSFRVYNSKYDGGEYQELALLKTASESLNEYSVQIKSLIGSFLDNILTRLCHTIEESGSLPYEINMQIGRIGPSSSSNEIIFSGSDN